MKHFYLYASNNDSKNLFHNNTGSAFTVELPKYLILSEGEWEICLKEIRVIGNLLKRDFCVKCSLCAPDPVYGIQTLRRVWVKGDKGFQTRYSLPFYVPLISNEIKRFEVVLEPLNNNYPDINVNSCELTLHFKKCRTDT
jgi:hypothetical protein